MTREEKKAAKRAQRALDRVSIETWGRTQPVPWTAATGELRRSLTMAANSIRAALSALSPLVGGAAVPGVDLVATYARLKGEAEALMRARPACVCAWCKNESALREGCAACSGHGYLSQENMGRVPEILKAPDIAMDRGRPVALEPVEAPVAEFDCALPYSDDGDGGAW